MLFHTQHAFSSKQPNVVLLVGRWWWITLRNVCTLVVNSFPPTLKVTSPSSYLIARHTALSKRHAKDIAKTCHGYLLGCYGITELRLHMHALLALHRTRCGCVASLLKG